MTITIATWNVNSIRLRLNHLAHFLRERHPDILCLQEIKCTAEMFPMEAFVALGYNVYLRGQKGYNGVTILSKFCSDEVVTNFSNNPLPDEARFIECGFKTHLGFFRVISLYVPNGGELGSEKFAMKLNFYDKLRKYLVKRSNFRENFCICGDYNVAPFDMDVYSPEEVRGCVGFSLEERKKLRMLINSGFDDVYRALNPNNREFSWWDYRGGAYQRNHGMRIDAILCNAKALSLASMAAMVRDMRNMDKPSDHVPVVVQFG